MLKVGNWIGELTTTIGSGTISLGGALPGFATFSSLGDGNTVWYAIIDGDNREAGIGTITGGTLERTDPQTSIINGVYADGGVPPISLTGSADVYCTFNALAFSQFISEWVNEDTPLKFGDSDGEVDYSEFKYISSTDSMHVDLKGANDTFKILKDGLLAFTFTGSTGSLLATGNLEAYSDIRLKTDIRPLLDSLDKCRELVGYNYKRIDLDLIQDGLLAQDIQKVLPDSVSEDGNGLLSASYNGVVALLVNCVNDLHNRILKLEQNNDSTS